MNERIHTNENEGSVGSCLGRVFFTFVIGLSALVLLAAASSGGKGSLSYDPHNCQISQAYPANVQRWCGLITAYARQNQLPPDLIAALILQESGGNPSAYSHSGAVGLMQVMPRDGIAATFRCNDQPCFTDRPSAYELRDSEFNVEYGTRLLSDLVTKYSGNLREALHAYGPYDVGYAYADAVLSIYQRYSSQ